MAQLKDLLLNNATIYRLRTLTIHNTKDVCDEVVIPLLKRRGPIVGDLINILDPSMNSGFTRGS